MAKKFSKKWWKKMDKLQEAEARRASHFYFDTLPIIDGIITGVGVGGAVLVFIILLIGAFIK